MTAIRLVLADQLSAEISSLKDYKEDDVVLFCEVLEETKYVKHHKKKIAFLFAAMRHFANEIKEKYKIEYIKISDVNNQGSFKSEVKRIYTKYNANKVIVTFPGEYRVLKDFQSWDLNIEIREDDRFLCSIDEFKNWANNKKSILMEYFYRDMRKRYSILMDKNKPIGNKWNFDSQNRKKPSDDISIPKPKEFKPDKITKEVLDYVEDNFKDHFGDLYPFYFAVTRKQALDILDVFISQRLSSFGDYQDAMLEDEPWMFHSHISFYLNCGLLNPKEVISKAIEAYNNGAPLNSVEGFIRQIIGWREFVRGVYWLKMPEYKSLNYLEAKNKLPSFFWDANTDLNCLKQSIGQTIKYSYAHHIQRLMVIGNFSLIIGLDPKEVNEWYLIVYADAYEWVELPNVTGMILFADAGFFASKPYAGGGSYINKMSNYCKNCKYKVSKKTGEEACPFNYLYWDFLERNKEKLKTNNRISMMYNIYDKMQDSQKEDIKKSAENFLTNLYN